MTDPWHRYGNTLYRAAPWFFFLGTLLLAPLLVLSLRLMPVIQGDGFEVAGENMRSQQQLKQAFGVSVEPLLLILRPTLMAEIPSEQFRQQVLDWLPELEGLPLLAGKISPLDSPDWLTDQRALLLIDPVGDSVVEENENGLILLEQLRGTLSPYLVLEGTGGGIIKDEIKQISQRDLIRAEMIALPVAFVVLLYAFGGFWAALLPLFTAALSILSTMGLLYLISFSMPLSIFVLNVTSLVGVAVSIDFALILISRLAVEWQRGEQPLEQALSTAVATAGRAIAFSALSVFIGLSGLLWFDINTFRSIALSGMAVVVLSGFVSLLILPAALARIGPWVLRHSRDTSKPSALVRVMISFGINWPVSAVLLTLALLAVMIWPLSHSRLEMPGNDALPAEHPARQTLTEFQQALGTEQTNQLELLLTLPGPLTEPEAVRELQRFSSEIAQREGVQSVQSVLSFLPVSQPEQISLAINDPRLAPVRQRFVNDNLARVTLTLGFADNSAASVRWIRDFLAERDQYYDSTTGDLAIAGQVLFNHELSQEIADKLWICLGWVTGATALVLMLVFRSVLIPIKAILINLLGLLATLGVVGALVQAGLLGLQQGDLFILLPVLVFALVFGLSMDYEVFLISRIQEAYRQSGDNNLATEQGLLHSARVVTSAALIMIVVAAAFTFTPIKPVQQLGLGIAFNIALEATLLRLILVPGLMRLMGHWNWWPGNRANKAKQTA